MTETIAPPRRSTASTLAEQRAALAERAAAARAEEAAAALDDPTALETLLQTGGRAEDIDRAIAALDDAAELAARRERNARERDLAEYRARLRLEIAQAAERRLNAIADAEQAAIALGTALAAAQHEERAIRTAACELGGAVPVPLFAHETARRASTFIAAALRPVAVRNGFGDLEWTLAAPRVEGWAEAERIKADISELTREDRDHG